MLQALPKQNVIKYVTRYLQNKEIRYRPTLRHTKRNALPFPFPTKVVHVILELLFIYKFTVSTFCLATVFFDTETKNVGDGFSIK